MVTMTGQVQRQRQHERWRHVGVLVGAVALLVAFGAQLIVLMPTKYTATSAIALRPMTGSQGADIIEMEAHEYSVALGADELAAEVAAAVTPADHRPSVSVTTTQDPGTSTVRIAVTSTDRGTAIAVSDGLVDRATQRGQSDEIAKVVTVIRAGESGVTSAPPRALYMAALVALAALLLGGGLYQIRERTS